MIERDRSMEAVCALVLVVLAVSGCSKEKSEASEAPAASSASPSVSPPSAPSPASVKYVIDPMGKTSIDMPAPAEHIKADSSASSGELRVDLMNLANSRGEVRVDLTTLRTRTFGEAAKDGKQTEHAITWLEVGDKVSPEVRERNRWVSFTIRSIDGLSSPDLTKVVAGKIADDEVRTVTLTAHGDFLLHGHKVDKAVALEARFHYPAGASPDSKPARLDLVTKVPLHVVLAEHDVKPRDNLGAIAQGAFGLLGTKVAETADVTLDLHARLAP
jgi:hypothetical protein